MLPSPNNVGTPLDLGDTVWRDANGLGEPMLGQAVRDQELFFSAFRRE
jgi:hypothetical protein